MTGSRSPIAAAAAAGLYRPAAGGDLDLRASPFAIHLVLRCRENGFSTSVCVRTPACSSGLVHARPLGWHHSRSAKPTASVIVLQGGNGALVPARLSLGGEGRLGKFWLRV